MRRFRALGSMMLASWLLAACGSVTTEMAPDGGPPDARTSVDAREGVDGAPPVVDAVPSPGVILAHSAGELYAFEVDELLRTIGPIVWPPDADSELLTDLAVDGSGRVVGTSFTSIYELDPETAEATLLAPLAVNLNGLAFLPTPAGEALYGTTDIGDVYKINPDTGGATRIGPFGSNLGSSGDLAWIPGQGLVGIVFDRTMNPTTALTSLARVDPATGAATVIGPTGISTLYGIAFADGVLYGFAPEGARVLIDPRTGAATPLATDPVSWWGAGSRP